MSYAPISGVIPQFSNAANELASGYYLKFYIANTTTPLSMATDSTGGTLLAKCKLNTDGMPISNEADNTTTFIPHVSEDYRFVIYLNDVDADANTTGSAFVNLPSVNFIPKSPNYLVSALPAASGQAYGRAIVTDATATTFASTVAGGGSNIVPVYSDGTNWKIG